MKTRKQLPAKDQELKTLLSLAGIELSGDVGDLTCYTRKNGAIVIFPKSPPDKPPSIDQLRQRLRFKNAQQAWMTQTTAVKRDWENITHRCALQLTGQNLYMSFELRPDNGLLTTLRNKSGINVAAPTPV